MTSAADLLLLPADEIQYPDLDGRVLYELAVQQDEPFIATSALGELASRDSTDVVKAAQIILGDPWDHHLTAYALKLLFRRDHAAGMTAMRSLIGDDPVILAAMIDNVLAEPEVFASHRDLVAEIAARAAALPAGDFSDPDERAAFLARYGG